MKTLDLKSPVQLTGLGIRDIGLPGEIPQLAREVGISLDGVKYHLGSCESRVWRDA